MPGPRLVLISDIHFSVPTLEPASAALRMALDKARELYIPLVIAGDLTDTKAIIRAEVANRLIELFREFDDVSVYVLVGNHDLINEKGTEHALNFLTPYASIIDQLDFTMFHRDLNIGLIPYFSDTTALQELLKTYDTGTTLIMHQGVQTADMGHYVQDKSSLPKECFSKLRVISGHYHLKQDIQCGPERDDYVGTFSYIGNPYTLGFGEAKHGMKGFRILNWNGSLDFVPANLRKHVVVEFDVEGAWPFPIAQPKDMVYVRASGSRSHLNSLSKEQFRAGLNLPHSDFKLELVPHSDLEPMLEAPPKNDGTLFDSMIDKLNEPKDHKNYLKDLWRSIDESQKSTNC
jgi:hypothetical protein